MADSVRIIDTGWVSLDRKLDELANKVQTSVIRKTMTRVGRVLLADVKALVPRSDPKAGRRGDKTSLVSRIKKKSVKTRRSRKGPRQIGVQIESQKHTGTWLELGTKERFRNASRATRGQTWTTGQIKKGKFSFIRRAAERNRLKLKRTFGVELRKMIRAEAARKR